MDKKEPAKAVISVQNGSREAAEDIVSETYFAPHTRIAYLFRS